MRKRSFKTESPERAVFAVAAQAVAAVAMLYLWIAAGHWVFLVGAVVNGVLTAWRTVDTVRAFREDSFPSGRM
jgi:hypothetical protein